MLSFAKFIFFTFLIICLKCVSSSSNVPFLLWTNIRDLNCEKSSSSLKESVSSLLSDDYVDCLSKGSPDQVVVFVYDKLGVEDFTRYGQTNNDKSNTFSNLNRFIKNYDSLMIPELEPINAVEDIFSKFEKVSKKIEVVRLAPFDRSDSSAVIKGLKEADNKVLENINSVKGNYVAILTADNPLGEGKLRYKRDTGRHLLANKDESSLVYLTSDCVLMTFESVNISVTKVASKKTFSSTLVLADAQDPKFTSVKCLPKNATSGDVTASISFKATASPFQTVDLTMVFNKNFSAMTSRYWWKLSEVELSYTTNSTSLLGQTSLALNPYLFENSITAPDGFSFVCANTTGLTYIDVTKKTTTTRNDTVDLQFNALQVEPFTKNSTRTFSEASDCVGWYTGPIWSGLIVSFILVMILTYGIGMMSYVTTMDRFDDPKGKTMTVPQEST